MQKEKKKKKRAQTGKGLVYSVNLLAELSVFPGFTATLWSEVLSWHKDLVTVRQIER